MIVVTGGAGFIGSALVWALNNRGMDDILVVDELGSDERWKNLRSLSFADYVEKDDFLEMVTAAKTPPGIKAVMHMGACSDTTERNVSYLIKNNYEYTKLLAQWATNAKVAFIYASSAATYGDGSAGFADNVDKLETLKPLNAYGYSKQLFDLWARRTGLLKEIVGLKYFNVFGPNEYHKGEMRSFILKAFEQIQARGWVGLFKSCDPEYADGEYVRDFIYVKDAVEMTLFFLDNPAVGGLYNIGTGTARTWNDMVQAVFAAMDKKPDIRYVQMPDSIRSQYQYFTQADITKLQKAAHNKQITSLEDAINDYVKEYLQKCEYLG